MNRGFLVLKGGNVEVTGAPEIISVLPLGHVISDKGEFNVDEESFRVMKAQIAQRGVDLVIDYEHQTLKGVQAPAAGWVKELMLKNGQIQARVEWTPTAKKYLQNKEYRYLSPVITVRESDSKATGLHSLALTNTPAIEGMTPLINSRSFSSTIGTNGAKPLRKQTDKGEVVSDEEQYDEILRICERLGISKEDLTKYGGIGIALDDTKALERNKTDDATRRICLQLGISEADLIKYNIK